MKAIWKNQVIAESDDTIVVEGNHYFPPGSINQEYFKASQNATICPWKGRASYFDIKFNGDEVRDAAWYYSNPSDAAAQIKNYVAFWRGIDVSK